MVKEKVFNNEKMNWFILFVCLFLGLSDTSSHHDGHGIIDGLDDYNYDDVIVESVLLL